MKFKNENIIKIIKTNKILAAVGFSLLVGSFAVLILFISLANIQYEKDEKKLKNFNKICLSEKTLQKAYLNITWISEAFATYGDKTSAYYYVSDGNHYYIVYLSKKKGLELSRQDLKKKPAKINGSTFTIDDSLKEIAIEDYNYSLEEGEEPLTQDNFYMVFGRNYLDQTSEISSKYDLYMAIGITASAVMLFSGIILGLVGMMFLSSLKKINDIDKQLLDSEMNNRDSHYYNRNNIYLTPNYIIVLAGRVFYYKYSDILWMYSYEGSYNGIPINKSINILTKDAKISMFANDIYWTEKSRLTYQEIWDKIISKNSDIKLGYTKENKEYFNEIVKNIKKERNQIK